MTDKARTPPASPDLDKTWIGKILFGPLVWGGLLTVGFYGLIPHLPAYRPLAQRYFCGHPLEYATTALFFVGMAVLGLKALRLSGENAALAHDPLQEMGHSTEGSLASQVERIEHRLRELPAEIRRSQLVRRIRDACDHLRSRGSTADLEHHLKYLADLASERLHESYAPVRTITWAVPILGFLGTVIGITLAIANVTPEQLSTSLNEVTSGLAVAFDTTALALALSLILVFAAFLTERAEQGILARVEEYGIKRIAPLFPARGEAGSPFIQAESRAAGEYLQATEQLIDRHTQLWRESLDGLRQRWAETLERQQDDLDRTLQQGVTATLRSHSEQLQEVRTEFLQAFQRVSDDLAADHRARTEQIEAVMQSFAQTVGGWQEQLDASSEAGRAQLEELRRQGDVLSRVVAQEEELSRLQAKLGENLEAVRAADTFQETLHSLNAAVHLLTARVRPNAA